jgi:septal ring factor EnvC (AmiA/AmiB activator)
MSNHLGDTNKMVDTPRTDAHIEGLRRNPQVSGCDSTLDFSRQLERELNAANYEVQHLREAYIQLQEGNERQRQRIKRLEDAGDAMEKYIHDQTNTRFIICAVQWRKAKEAKP